MTSKIREIDKEKAQNEYEDRFPSHIGFGALDISRIRTECPEYKNGEPIFYASYVTSKGELVYEVRLEKESCYVEEFFEGNMIGGTKSTTLEETFCRHFLWWGSNPRFRKMIGRITRDKNVALVRPGRDGFRSMYFPEGLIFVLRLPLVPDDRITEIEPHLRDISTHVSIDGVYGGEVITAGQGRITHYFARFVDFSATLWNLEETLDLIFERGLVPQYPEMGLYILDPKDAAPGSFKVYLGEEGTRMEAYGHVLDRPGDIHVIEAEEIITSAVNQMKGMRNGQSTQLN